VASVRPFPARGWNLDRPRTVYFFLGKLMRPAFIDDRVLYTGYQETIVSECGGPRDISVLSIPRDKKVGKKENIILPCRRSMFV
jgi:hypothetical protein